MFVQQRTSWQVKNASTQRKIHENKTGSSQLSFILQIFGRHSTPSAVFLASTSICVMSPHSAGREPEQIGLTVSYSLPASRHMLLLYKGCLETKRALQIHSLYTLLKTTTEKCLWKKCVCNSKTSVLANPSAL